MNYSAISLTVLLAVALTPPALASEGDQLWQEAYGGAAADRGGDMAVTADGGLILTGYTNSMGEGGTDIYLVKLAADGTVEWENAYGSAANDRGNAVIQTPDGAYLVAGCRDIGTVYTYDGLLLKVEADGVEQWQQTYGGSGEDRFHDVVACTGGGYAVAGSMFSSSLGVLGWLVKVDDDGVLQWESAEDLDSYGADYLQGLVETARGNLVATGYSSDGNTFPEYDAKLVRFDAGGNLLWIRTFSQSIYDRGYAIALASDGGFAFAGTAGGGMTIWRTNASGNEIWQHTFNTVTSDYALALTATSDGGFLAGGSTYNYDDGLFQMYVGKTDAEGQPLWENLYGGAGDEGCQAVAETPGGNYALLGTTNSFGAGGDDLILIEVEGPSGVTATGDLPVADLSWRLTAAPNPFNPATVFRLELAASARVDITVLDLRGRLIRTLASGDLMPAGSHEFRWDGRDDRGGGIPSGTYLVRARAGGQQAGCKVMLLK
jgi:hypothetical protein